MLVKSLSPSITFITKITVTRDTEESINTCLIKVIDARGTVHYLTL